MSQRPAPQDSSTRPPERKALFRGKTDGGFGTFLGSIPLATELMEYGRIAQGIPEAKGVRCLLRQCHRLLALRQPLVRIAQQPECMGVMAAARHTSILPIEKRIGAVLLGIVKRYTLRKMRVRLGCCAQIIQRRPQSA